MQIQDVLDFAFVEKIQQEILIKEEADKKQELVKLSGQNN